MTHDVTSAPSIAALRKVHSPWMDVGRSLAAALGILTAGFETGYDSLKADDLVLQDVDLMLRIVLLSAKAGMRAGWLEVGATFVAGPDRARHRAHDRGQ